MYNSHYSYFFIVQANKLIYLLKLASHQPDYRPILTNSDLFITIEEKFVQSLSSCHEKATVALYFGRNHTRLGVVHF